MFEVFEIVFTISYFLKFWNHFIFWSKIKGAVFVSYLILALLPAHRKQEEKN